jgi:CRP-like cAMP-binding protein
MPTYRNLLLSSLPVSELASLEPLLERMVLPVKVELIHPDQTIDSVFFLETGLGSEVIVSDGEHQIEVGLVGYEGLVGLAVVLGKERSPHKTFMQIGGDGLRISAKDLSDLVQRSPVLRSCLLRYAHDFMLQLGQTVYANGRHKIPARLARWLLMSADRVSQPELRLTHEFLGLMLGVRRAGVSEALAVLQDQDLIRTSQSSIVIINRAGLEALAGSIYVKPDWADRLPRLAA